MTMTSPSDRLMTTSPAAFQCAHSSAVLHLGRYTLGSSLTSRTRGTPESRHSRTTRARAHTARPLRMQAEASSPDAEDDADMGIEAMFASMAEAGELHESKLEEWEGIPLINSVVLTGRLARDPVLKTVKGNLQLCTFTMAVEEEPMDPKDNAVSWFDIETWGSLATTASRLGKKGFRVGITGSIGMNQWTGSDGLIRESPIVRAISFEILQSKSESFPESQNMSTNNENSAASQTYRKQSDFEDKPDLSNLPF